MSKILIPLLILILLPFQNTIAETAKEIVKKSDDLIRGKSSEFLMELTVMTPNWERTNKIKGYMRGLDEAFLRFLTPAKDKNTGFLKVGYNLWMYLPKIERIIKIPPTMMRQSMMGSDFSYDDMVKESSIVRDYIHQLVTEEAYGTREAYVIKMTPKEDAPVVYGGLKIWIEKKTYIPLRVNFYDEKGKLIKFMKYSNIKKLGERVIPTYMEMRDLSKKGHKTIIKYIDIKFDIDIPDEIFTQRNLRKL